MGLKNVTVKLGADIKEFTSKMKKASKTFKNVGSSLKSTGRSMSRNLTGPIALLGTGAVMAAAKFEKSMNKVKAVTGATGNEFHALNEQAKDLGKSTQFSASQAAEAMSFLGMAGFDTQQIMAAMPATLDLAAAGGLDLAQAADIASNVLSGFGAEASELGKFSDVMAKGFTSSNTSLEGLGNAMKMVAPVSAGFGISMEETTAAIGKLSDAGIQGESAGTGLRGILATLSDKAGELGINVFDAAGKMLPLKDSLAQIEKKGTSTAEIMSIFGKKAGPSMLALLKTGSKGLADYTAELKDSGGTAKNVANTQMEGLAGTITRLKSATEGIAIQFGQMLIPILEKLANKLSDAITFISNMSTKSKTIVLVVAGLLAVLGPVVTLFGTLATVIGAILSPVGLVVAAIAGIAIAFLYVRDNFEAFKERMGDWSWWRNALIQALQWLIEYNPMSLVLKGFNSVLEFFGKNPIPNAYENLAAGLEDLKTETKEYEHEFKSFGESMKNQAGEIGTALGNMLSSKGQSAGIVKGGTSEEATPETGAGGLEAIGLQGLETAPQSLELVNSGIMRAHESTITWSDKLANINETFTELATQYMEQFAAGFVNLFNKVTDAEGKVLSFGEKFKTFAVDFLKQIAVMIAQAAVLAGLMSATGLGGATGAGSFLTNFLGNISGRASGGPVAGNTPYMVGEVGPELFMPNSAGTIIPNNALGGGAPAIADVTISGSDLLLIFNKAKQEQGGVNV